MSCSSSDELKLARAAIQDEIVIHQVETIKEPYTRPNTHCSIDRLFPELLAEIFMYARDMDRRRGFSHRWICVSHVCRYWRDVAIRYPCLWCRITLHRRDRIEEFLRRSKEAPLCIKAVFPSLTPWRRPHSLVVQRIVEELHRIQDMHIHNHSGISLRAPLSNAITAPALQRLVIRDTDQAKLPEFLFNGGAPMLEELHINSFAFVWRDGFCHSRMKHLTIGKVQCGSHTPRLSTIIATLNGMPLLETLDLQRVPSLQPAEVPNDCPVNLPHLRSLSLASRVLDFGGLLGCLILSPQCAISLRGSTLGDKTIVMDDLSKLLGAKPLRSLQIAPSNDWDDDGINSMGWIVSTAPGTENDPGIKIQITRAFDTLGHVDLDVFSLLCQLLSTKETEEVSIERLRPHLQHSWTRLFSHMRNLRILCLIDTPVADVLSALLVHHSAPQYLLPRLDVLKFQHISFPINHAGRYAGLEDCLIERYESGFEIPKLIISHVNSWVMRSHAIKSLQEIVPDIIWEAEPLESDLEAEFGI